MVIKHQHLDLLGKIILQRVVFTPPFKAVQSMQDEACFIYAINGKSTMYGGAERYSLSTDESVLMKCGSYINSWHSGTDDTPYEAVAIHLYPDVLKHVYKNDVPSFLLGNPGSPIKQIHKIAPQEAIKNYIQGMIYYFENPFLVNEELMILKIKELVLLLYQTNSIGIRELLKDLFNPTKLEFKEIINQNLCEDLSMEDFALLTNLSLSSFKRKFKKTFEDSPARYIKTKRLEKAADLLKVSNKRITDICFDCGFNDLGHFSKSFTVLFGCAPSDYRKAYLDQINQ